MLMKEGGKPHESAAINAFLERVWATGLPVLNCANIIICFENYFKALLLLNKFIIHQVNRCHPTYDKAFRPLSNKQNDRPLLQTYLESEVSQITLFPEPNNGIYQSLVETTIPFRTLTKTSYQQVYGLPGELYDILSQLNQQRKSLLRTMTT
ncbi:hypothetical protein U27_03114 [Candidatus Vecturithrix granuli]|uniref:Uncharacterized protein n=1 Tax=Vecturithrix granuli TaxID=1499967 RepID=A0A081BUZ7_VECG1|nr:hypothetical protein U27_03114 [Candidatus Vecturithrix granuli]